MGGSRAKGAGAADSEERKKARELAERTGVPLWGAFRVIRGETTLDKLLKSMLRREKFQKLQSKDGLDPDLAGHVASGTLPLWRAQLLMEMRQAGRRKFTRDRLEMLCQNELAVSVWCFGHDDWLTGRVLKSRTYDFSFAVDGSEEPEVILKHDVKMVCSPDDLETVRKESRFDKKVLKEGLGASRDRKDRYRPGDDLLSDLLKASLSVKWVFRDGRAILGKVASFGRWDLDLELDGGAPATLFFHALHQATERQLSQALRKK